MPRTIFLDLDGTLIDPKPGITGSIQHALRAMGFEPPDADSLEWCIGPPLSESFPALIGPDGDIDRAIDHYRDRFSSTGMFQARVFDGVPDMLAGLRGSGYRCFLATTKPHLLATRIVEHFRLDDHLDAIFGSELDGTRSDKTSLVRFALDRTGSRPSESVMLGDRRHDIAGARANSVWSIGALWGYGQPGELEAAGADALVRHPAEVAGIVARRPGPDIS